MGDRVILHSDCNCFYASVELLHHPELRGKPLDGGGELFQRVIAKLLGTGDRLHEAHLHFVIDLVTAAGAD